MHNPQNIYSFDLIGLYRDNPHYLQTRDQINRLVHQYLSLEILTQHLTHITEQFKNPQPRQWQPINWQAINCNQIIGVEPEIFFTIIATAAEVEAPICAYTKESWDYLQKIHPNMADFMGGKFTPEGTLLEAGVWEQEERQHAPTFQNIYQQLTGKKLSIKTNSVAGYPSTEYPWLDVYKHTLSRIGTEWAAVSIYLWLMAHSTGPLQQAISQPLQDEIHHLAKIWGFSRWAFGASYWTQIAGTTQQLMSRLRHHQSERTYGENLLNRVIKIDQLSIVVELCFVLTRVLVRLRRWNTILQREDLQLLFGKVPVVSWRPDVA